MENRVGDNTPAATKFAELAKKLSDVIGELEKFCITLSKDERKRLLRSRRDAEPMMQRIADLATRHKVTVPGVELSSMQNDLKLGQALLPLEAQLERALQLVQDTGAQADTEAWQAFLAYYGVLSSLADRNPDIENGLGSVVEYMRHRRKSVAKEPEPAKAPAADPT